MLLVQKSSQGNGLQSELNLGLNQASNKDLLGKAANPFNY